MGRYSWSAPGSRYGLRPWFRVGNVDVTTTVLVAALAVISIFVWSIDQETALRLALIPDLVREGQVWRVVTWPFVNDPDLWTIITIAIFWYFGTEIESRLGRNRFAIMLVALAVVPGIVATIFDVSQAGIRPLEFGVFLVFILEFPYARFFFGIPAWVLGLVFIGLEILQLMSVDDSEGILVLFVSLATAALLARAWGLAESVPWIPKLPLPGTTTTRTRSRSRGSGRRVVEGPWGSSSTGLPAPPSPAYLNDQAELDSLLDKINAQGMDSLTGGEKKRLNELSKRLRER
jgi:membrane associated rhomboid family serine protease